MLSHGDILSIEPVVMNLRYLSHWPPVYNTTHSLSDCYTCTESCYDVTAIIINKWVRSLRSLHPLGSLRSLQLLRAWLSLASLAQSHGCDDVGKERD